QIHQEVVLFDADVERIKRLGRAMRITFEEIWQIEGEARLRAIVQQADQGVPEVGFRVVSLTAPVGDPGGPVLSTREREALAAGDTVRVVQQTAADGDWRYSYVPLSIAGARPAAIEVRESLKRQMTYIHMSHLAILFATLSVAVMCGLIATGL